jgi:hypothetical protein
MANKSRWFDSSPLHNKFFYIVILYYPGEVEQAWQRVVRPPECMMLAQRMYAGSIPAACAHTECLKIGRYWYSYRVPSKQ